MRARKTSPPPHVSSKRHILPYLIASLNMRGFKVQGGVSHFTEYVTLHQGTNPTLWVAINQGWICGAFGFIQITKDYTLETLLQEGTPNLVPFLSQEDAIAAYPQAQIIGLSITESHAL